MSFYAELKEIALKYAPKSPVKVGDIVETTWCGWKRPHKVYIYCIDALIVDLNPSTPWTDDTEFLGIDLIFFAKRLKKDGSHFDKNGSGIVLSNFKTSSGVEWTKKYEDFNHVGFYFKIDEN